MPEQKFLIPHRDYIHVVDYSAILFFKSDNCYTHVFLSSGAEYVLVKSLSKLEKELNSPRFIRISQSFLVNCHCITSINKKTKTVMIGQEHALPFTVSIKTLVVHMTGQ
jgi:two-component system LytT family response regulator